MKQRASGIESRTIRIARTSWSVPLRGLIAPTLNTVRLSLVILGKFASRSRIDPIRDYDRPDRRIIQRDLRSSVPAHADDRSPSKSSSIKQLNRPAIGPINLNVASMPGNKKWALPYKPSTERRVRLDQ